MRADQHRTTDGDALPGWNAVRGSPVLRRSPARSRSKRAFDIFLALALIVFTAPLLLSIALLVRITSSGPALFRQGRTGLDGRVFQIAKFRTMRVAEAGAAVEQARRVDPRVTRLGRFLRRSSLDELPQLFNVLSGDMSLVGPRPHAIFHDDVFASRVPAYRDRFRTRPGITGLAQANGFRGEIQTEDQLEQRIRLDNDYIERWSLGLDVLILIQTALRFAFHKTAY